MRFQQFSIIKCIHTYTTGGSMWVDILGVFVVYLMTCLDMW